MLLRFFAWCYRRLNSGEGIPSALFAPRFELHQAAALIDSAGTFTGPDSLDRVLEELTAAFSEIRFEPQSAVEVDADRLLFIVRFQASGRGSGLQLDRTIGHLFTIEGGSATRLDVYWEESEALAAAGPPPGVPSEAEQPPPA
jgi:ketosteroid isomerase-like protein